MPKDLSIAKSNTCLRIIESFFGSDYFNAAYNFIILSLFHFFHHETHAGCYEPESRGQKSINIFTVLSMRENIFTFMGF